MSAQAYENLATLLQEFNFPTTIVPLTYWDWLSTLAGGSVAPILNKLAHTANQMMVQYGVEQINLVAHSAGGWISRIYLGHKSYSLAGDPSGHQPHGWNGRSHVATLVTLGTPHRCRSSLAKRNMTFVNQMYPEAFYSDVRYVCVAGKAFYGERRWKQWIAYSSYQLTCGEGNSWGDGITPLQIAHLQGAENLVFQGVQHFQHAQELWYGSPEILSAWAPFLA